MKGENKVLFIDDLSLIYINKMGCLLVYFFVVVGILVEKLEEVKGKLY